MLYKIGDFSKINNIPVKTLRYYDEIYLGSIQIMISNLNDIDIFRNYLDKLNVLSPEYSFCQVLF